MRCFHFALCISASLLARAINPPMLISPCWSGSGPVLDPALPIVLTWTTSPGAMSYQVQAGYDIFFLTNLVDQTTMSTSFNLSGLDYSHNCSWRVRATDGISWSAWTLACAFITADLPAPMPIAPLNGAIITSSSANLLWSSTPASSSAVHISTSPTFSPLFNVGNVSGTTYTVTGLSFGQTYYWRARGTLNGVTSAWSSTRSFTRGTVLTEVNARVFLQGPLNTSTLLMDDALRTSGLIPASEPYSALGYSGIMNTAATVSPTMMAVTGANAVVDWVLMEVLHGSNSTILARWALLLQRDGDVTMPDGSIPAFHFPAAQVRIAMRHRTHLGALCAAVHTPIGSAVSVDMTAAATPMYGSDPTALVSGYRALWCGDVDGNGMVNYVGVGNDRDPILMVIGGSVPTNTLYGAYAEDANMDGVVRYVGSNNDRDLILVTVGGSIPTATRTAQLP